MGLHRFAVVTALATFCLLIAGGLVSTTESGLACPDWPLCEGKLIPRMVDGKQFEHTHRLVASAVATMTFVLCAMIFKRRRADRVLTRLGAVAAVLVVVQALLGALTVKLALPAWVSSLHLATAMAFFCTTVTLAFLTRQRLPGFSSESLNFEDVAGMPCCGLLDRLPIGFPDGLSRIPTGTLRIPSRGLIRAFGKARRYAGPDARHDS